jgi:hypothetical protein
VLVLVSAMRYGLGAKRMAELRHLVGVSRRTVERWRRWWQEVFVATLLWKASKARFLPPVEGSRMPASLLERFAGDERGQLLAALKFLRPLSVGCGVNTIVTGRGW